MINTSNEFDNSIMQDRKFLLSSKITLADNTILELGDSDIMQGGMEFEDAVSGNGSFQIGCAIINKNTLTLNNTDGKFDAYDFTGATIIPYVGLQLSQTVEKLKKGFFTVDESKAIGGLIRLESLDNMHKFERPFKEVTINFPTTAINLLTTICSHCGIILATPTFTNSDFIIQSRPDDEALSCLDMVSYIAQLGGNFARCNTDGELEIKWYDLTAFEQDDDLDGGAFDDSTPYVSGDSADGGDFTDYSSGDSFDGGTFIQTKRYHHIYNFGATPTIAVDDVVITGIKVESNETENQISSLYGSSGYVLSLMNNPLIQSQSDADLIASLVGAKIIGMRFRPFSASVLSNPCYEAGDPVFLSIRTRKGFNTYQSFITELHYKVNSREAIKNEAETPNKNSSTRYSAQTKTIVESRKMLQEKLNAYDLAVQQLNSVMANAMGYYTTSEKQEDGSNIDYMHDKPALAESQIIWKKTINGFAVSTDGGQTWASGFTADGNIVAKTLAVIGINAEWIKVLTSFTVGTQFSVDKLGKLIASNADITGKITADSGKIGPFTINSKGLFSSLIEFYEDSNYPLIWLTKKGPNGESWGNDGTQRANYEPSAVVVRAIEDNIETDVFTMARDDTQGIKGKINITRFDKSTNLTKSETTLTENGITWNKYDSVGRVDSSTQISDTNILLQKGDFIFGITLDPSDGTAYISAHKVNINGQEF